MYDAEDMSIPAMKTQKQFFRERQNPQREFCLAFRPKNRCLFSAGAIPCFLTSKRPSKTVFCAIDYKQIIRTLNFSFNLYPLSLIVFLQGGYDG